MRLIKVVEEKEVKKLDWSSDLDVLKRTSHTINSINAARIERNMGAMFEGIINLYKEISVELTKEENKVWEEIKVLRNKMKQLPENNDWLLYQFDDMDLKLRALAKRHGFLARNKKEGGDAAFDM